MNRKQMQRMSGGPENHACCPEGWRDVPNVSGDYDLDATMMHRENPNLPDRLDQHISKGSGPRTGYNGYHNYHGDS